MTQSIKESKASFALASRILGRKVALLALSRMAKKLKFFAGKYTPAVYESIVDSSMSVLGHATKWTRSPRKYKAHQKALHSLRDCLNSPEYWGRR
jgi:hypothetical protein